jgi:hypothetical protein
MDDLLEGSLYARSLAVWAQSSYCLSSLLESQQRQDTATGILLRLGNSKLSFRRARFPGQRSTRVSHNDRQPWSHKTLGVASVVVNRWESYPTMRIPSQVHHHPASRIWKTNTATEPQRIIPVTNCYIELAHRQTQSIE